MNNQTCFIKHNITKNILSKKNITTKLYNMRLKVGLQKKSNLFLKSTYITTKNLEKK